MTPLVLVHGFMGGRDQWATLAPLKNGREVIAFDLPGFGNAADAPPIDRIDAFAHWMLEALEHRGIQRFDLLGHSMGGMIVQEMIRRTPDRVRRLILYATGAQGVLPGRFESIETSMERVKADGAEATARRIAATWFLNGDADTQYPTCADIAARARLPAILAGLSAMRDWTGLAALPSIQSETLVLWGDQDRTYRWPQIETLWQSIPCAQLAVIPNCAHAVHLEKPHLFNALITDFLTDDRSQAERP